MKKLNYPNHPLRAEGGAELGFRKYHPLRQYGGQYAAPVGVSTKPERSAWLDWFQDEIRAAAVQEDTSPF